MNNVNLVILIVSAVIAGFGQVSLKLGASNCTKFTDYFNFWIYFGVLLYFSGAIMWVYVMSQESLTRIFPFTALTFLVVYVFGFFYLKEAMSLMSLMGLGLVLSGLYFLSR